MNLVPRKIGEDVTFTAHGHTFTVSRLSLRTWQLRDHSLRERARFGTRREIAEDVDYASRWGCLPPPAGPRW